MSTVFRSTPVAPRFQPEVDRVLPVLRSDLFSTRSSAAQRQRAQDLAWHWVGRKWARLLGAVDDRTAPQVQVHQPGAQLQAGSSNNGQTWSLAVAHREKDGGRTWLTRADVGTQKGPDGDVDVFSIVTACTPLDEAPRVLAPPGVLQLWVDRLGLDDGGMDIVGEARDVADDDQLDAFYQHVLSPQRRLPIVALCHQPRSLYYGVDPQALATAVRGVAHVACLTPQTSADVRLRWGSDLAPVAGAARLYSPNFHTGLAAAMPHHELAPLWHDPRPPGTPRSVEPGAYRRLLCQRVCGLSVGQRRRVATASGRGSAPSQMDAGLAC
jgi:hypothetical protein